jgi:hypothetical protein
VRQPIEASRRLKAASPACLEDYWLYLDQGGMNVPVFDAFKPRELLFRRLDCPFSGGRRMNNNRALAAAKKLIVSRNFIDEAHAIVWHRSRFPGRLARWHHGPGNRRTQMIWINFRSHFRWHYGVGRKR